MQEEPGGVSLEDRVAELEAKQIELQAVIASKENEFGKKRAKFKEIFIQKETELSNEMSISQSVKEENVRLLAELQKVSEERDNLKTAVLITQTSSDDKLDDVKARYQEEITSLKAIMHDAVHEARQDASLKYEQEQQRLIQANRDLEEKLHMVNATKSQNPVSQNDGNTNMESLFDVFPSPWKKASDTQEEYMTENAENLEDSMKKAQENAETLRAIVMPLEEEIATLRSKLKNAADKINHLESKERKHSKNSSTETNSQIPPLNVNVEEYKEKIKELSQYLEAERSSRTDLEMFVAVLNTQKGVLQEDADKLKRELHNVCRLLEQEKEEHVALKDTWEMANDRFLETQLVQQKQLDRIRQVLTAEQQQQLLSEQTKNKEEKVELITPPSPSTKTKYFNRKATKQNTKHGKDKKMVNNDPKKTLSSLARTGKNNTSTTQKPTSILDADIPVIDAPVVPLVPMTPPSTTRHDHPSTSTPNDVASLVDADRVQATFSDSESHLSFNETQTMKKYKSADDLKSDMNTVGTQPISSRSRSHDFEQQSNFEKSFQLENFVQKYGRDKIDLKDFEEEAKSSLSNEADHVCAMCINYEKQLQKLQGKNDDLSQSTADLSKQIKDEQENVTVLKRANERLEQSVKIAGEDAEAQIQAAFETQRDLETILTEIQANMEKTKRETAIEMKSLMESRDSLMARCEQLAENVTNLQSKGATGKGTEQAFEAVAETKIDKLQSEIHFMKDRIMAEQVAKDNLEEFYQSDIHKYQMEIKKLHKELEMERQQSKEQGQQQKQQMYDSSNSNEVIAVLEKQLQQASKEKDELLKRIKELKSQIHSLNGQLNTSESVQRDFVELSQSLQIELEEMKVHQKEIKWEHEDDVKSCRQCEKNLEKAQDKHHCHKCGRIFCDTCSTKTKDPSDSSKPMRVCNGCLLDVATGKKTLIAIDTES